MRTLYRNTLMGAVLTAASLLSVPALACGGFFCSQAQPVNQAAEGIIFADNGDGTTTAVIQILYQGPAKSFSWLLPISSVPKSDSDIGIASNLALQRLQGATNPNYTLTTRVEGTCREDSRGSNASGGSATAGGFGGLPMAGPAEASGGVTVEASGVVGAFEWQVISLNASLAEPADAAVEWLTTNGYDVPSGASNLLGPYLEEGMYLLALRLTKGADSGSIRPIVLTYDGTEASIPIKLTAVAANDDMGVLTWLLGKSRAVPKNYLSLELNEARINWFNAGSTYNSVVVAAADDAGGQGFVTEFAGSTSTLKDQVWTQNDEQGWSSFQNRVYGSFEEFFGQSYGLYSGWDGFWDATRAAVTLPANVTFEDFKLLPYNYAAQITFSPSAYIAELERSVIEPVKLVQRLIDAHPTLTRMYTTLSAEEMTLDPLFTFNPDLEDVSNLHTAERIIECEPHLYQFEAPWRIELPQGDVVRGTPADAQSLSWPSALDELPANSRIVRTSASGSGRVVEDNSEPIADLLADYNATILPGIGSGGSASGGMGNDISAAPTASGGGCNIAVGGSPWLGLLSAAALAAAALRRRRAP